MSTQATSIFRKFFMLNQAPVFRQIIKSKNKPRFLDKDAKSRQLTTTPHGGGQLKGLLEPFGFMSNFGTYSLIQDFVKSRDLTRFTPQIWISEGT